MEQILPNSTVGVFGSKNFGQVISTVVSKLWQGDESSIQQISDSANYVFSFIKTGKKYYLRLTQSDGRAKIKSKPSLILSLFFKKAASVSRFPFRPLQNA